MLHVTELRPDTRRVYEHLRDDPDIGRFLLIGGTAIALQHAHRESEDLDFIWVHKRTPESRVPELDRRVVARIIESLNAVGFTATLAIDQADLEDADNEGHDLMYAQQNWVVEGVKLTFFAAATPEKAAVFERAETLWDGNIRLLSSEALFEVKSRLLVERATSRDLYDLWFYLERQGHKLEEVIAFALDENPYYTDELIKKRLLPERPAVTDPGFLPRLSDGPQTFEELRSRLEDIVSTYERRVAEQIAAGLLRPK